MRGVPVVSSMQPLMAEPTHDPGQALLYIIISGDSRRNYSYLTGEEAFAHVEPPIPCGIQCALSQRQSKRNSQAVFPFAVILTAFAGIMSGLTLGLVRCFSVCLTWFCTALHSHACADRFAALHR
jgi:hypothetical protein